MHPSSPGKASSAPARIIPFALFMGWIAVDELLALLVRQGLIEVSDLMLSWLYLPRMAVTGLALICFWRSYSEIQLRDLRNTAHTLVSLCGGILIFALWINMDWTFDFQGQPRGFNPELFPDALSRNLMIVVRIAGAVVVVPIMEELFWRSWLLRYLIKPDFSVVGVGTFTLSSFAISSLLFGLEHHFILAGIMAGVLLNAICYLTRSMAQCIVAHAVANLLLAGYVLLTDQWTFW